MSETKARQAVLKKKHSKIIDYKKTFSSPEGRRVLLDMMDEHFMLRTTSDVDSLKQHENEGERKVMLRLMRILKFSEIELERIVEEIQRDVGATASEHGESTGVERTRIVW